MVVMNGWVDGVDRWINGWMSAGMNEWVDA